MTQRITIRSFLIPIIYNLYFIQIGCLCEVNNLVGNKASDILLLF